MSWGESGSGPGQFDAPIGIVIHGDEVFVSDSGNNRIEVSNREGEFLRSFGREGDAAGELDRPMHMDFRDGKLYVGEYLNDRIQVFSPAGESIALIGFSGSRPGEFDAPGGVAVTETGRLYVADFYNQRIQLLEPAGRYIRQISVETQAMSQLRVHQRNDVTPRAKTPGLFIGTHLAGQLGNRVRWNQLADLLENRKITFTGWFCDLDFHPC